MSQDLPSFDRPVESPDDVVAQWEAMRDWWVRTGGPEHGADVSVLTAPCPVTITCRMDGLVVSVAFADGAKAHMTDAAIAEALHRAALSRRIAVPDAAEAGDGEARLAAGLERLHELEGWLRAVLEGVGDAASVRRASNRDVTVGVVYRRSVLVDVVVQRRNWALFASEAEIEAAVVEASGFALGVGPRPIFVTGAAWASGAQQAQSAARYGTGDGRQGGASPWR